MSDKDREAFEKILSTDESEFDGIINKDKNDKYVEWYTQVAYKYWQAALDYARKEQRELLEKCEEALRSCRWMRESDYSCVGGYVQTWHNHKITSEALVALHAAGIGN